MRSLILHKTMLICAVWTIAFNFNDIVDKMLMDLTLNWLR